MDINELLRSVNTLISKVSLLDLQKRTTSYKQHASRETQKDIATPLSSYIDKLAAGQPAKASMHNNISEEPAGITGATSQEIPQTQSTAVIPNNLSDYLKSHSQHSDSDSYIGDKLKASTWSHIHTAILKAREGDPRTAKLHADIANQAMKEAVHYMSDEEFRIFSEEIDHALGELKQQGS
ncbi:MAG TPA: hypothetical protein VIQ03_14860 [Gammaproteobacteria bacterium]